MPLNPAASDQLHRTCPGQTVEAQPPSVTSAGFLNIPVLRLSVIPSSCKAQALPPFLPSLEPLPLPSSTPAARFMVTKESEWTQQQGLGAN